MKLTKCPQNHFFDADRYNACPHCSGDASAQPKPVSLTGAYRTDFRRTDGGSAYPVNNPPAETMHLTQSTGESSYPPPEPSYTPPQPSYTPPELSYTPPQPSYTPPESRTGQGADASPLAAAVAQTAPYSIPGADQKTVSFYDFGGNEPVVGWLVGVKGGHHGQSFPLKAGQNHIGRDLKMNVALTKDGEVSRNKHSVLTYDPKTLTFYLQPGDSGLTYLNGELVLVPRQLHARDKIELGGTALLLIPLCGDSFTWEEYKA